MKKKSGKSMRVVITTSFTVLINFAFGQGLGNEFKLLPDTIIELSDGKRVIYNYQECILISDTGKLSKKIYYYDQYNHLRVIEKLYCTLYVKDPKRIDIGAMDRILQGKSELKLFDDDYCDYHWSRFTLR